MYKSSRGEGAAEHILPNGHLRTLRRCFLLCRPPAPALIRDAHLEPGVSVHDITGQSTHVRNDIRSLLQERPVCTVSIPLPLGRRSVWTPRPSTRAFNVGVSFKYIL